MFDLLLKGYDSLSKSVIGNNDLARILSNPKVDSPAVDYFNEQAITNILGAAFLSQEDIIGIHVLTDAGKAYNYSNYANVISPDYKSTSWYTQISSSTGNMVWLGVFDHSILDQVDDRHASRSAGRSTTSITTGRSASPCSRRTRRRSSPRWTT